MLHEKYRPKSFSDLTMSNIKQEEFRKLMYAANSVPPRILVVHGRCGTGKRTALETLLAGPPPPMNAAAPPTLVPHRRYAVTFVDCVEHTTAQLVEFVESHLQSAETMAWTSNGGFDVTFSPRRRAAAAVSATPVSPTPSQRVGAGNNNNNPATPVLILRNPPATGERSRMQGYLLPLRRALDGLAAASAAAAGEAAGAAAAAMVPITIFLLTDHDVHSTKFEHLSRLPGSVHRLARFFHVPPVTEVMLRKRLTAILEQERLLAAIPDKAAVPAIVEAAEGDVRHALLQLEWYILPIRKAQREQESRLDESLSLSPLPAAVAGKKSKAAAAAAKKGGAVAVSSPPKHKADLFDDLFAAVTPPRPVKSAAAAAAPSKSIFDVDGAYDDDVAALHGTAKSAASSKSGKGVSKRRQRDEVLDVDDDNNDKGKKGKKASAKKVARVSVVDVDAIETDSSGGDDDHAAGGGNGDATQDDDENEDGASNNKARPVATLRGSDATNAVTFGAAKAKGPAAPAIPFNSAAAAASAKSTKAASSKRASASAAAAAAAPAAKASDEGSGEAISVRDEITSAAHTVGRLLCNKRTAEYALARCTAAPRKLLGYLFENAFMYFEGDNIRDLCTATQAMARADIHMTEHMMDLPGAVSSAARHADGSSSLGVRDQTAGQQQSMGTEGERALIVFHKQYARLRFSIPRQGRTQVMPETFVQPPPSWALGLPLPPREVSFASRSAGTGGGGGGASTDSFSFFDDGYDPADDDNGTGGAAMMAGADRRAGGDALRRVDYLQRLSGLNALSFVLLSGNVVQFPLSSNKAAVLDYGPMAARILLESAFASPSAPALGGGGGGGSSTSLTPIASQQQPSSSSSLAAAAAAAANKKPGPKRTLFMVKQKQDEAAREEADNARRRVLSQSALNVLQQSFVAPRLRGQTRLRPEYRVVPTLATVDGECFLGSGGAGGRSDATIDDPIEEDDEPFGSGFF